MVCSAAKSVKLFYGSLFKRSVRGSETHFLTCYFQIFSYFWSLMRSNWTIKSFSKESFCILILGHGFMFHLCPTMFSPDYPRVVCVRTFDRLRLQKIYFLCPETTKAGTTSVSSLVMFWSDCKTVFLCCISTNHSLETRLFDTESGCRLMNQLLYVNRSRIINLNRTLMTP